jgi:uncharacterized phage protein (TIGR01671 family)
MREIKFRARKKTVYNIGTTYESNMFSWVYYFPSDGLPKINSNEQWVSGQIEVQFTGLKDKNGKEIYEGDVIRISQFNGIYNYEGRALVTFNPWGTHFKPSDGRQSFGLMDHINDTSSYWYRDLNFSAITDKVELIGNIYENPELIKSAVEQEQVAQKVVTTESHAQPVNEADVTRGDLLESAKNLIESIGYTSCESMECYQDAVKWLSLYAARKANTQAPAARHDA